MNQNITNDATEQFASLAKRYKAALVTAALYRRHRTMFFTTNPGATENDFAAYCNALDASNRDYAESQHRYWNHFWLTIFGIMAFAAIFGGIMRTALYFAQ